MYTNPTLWSSIGFWILVAGLGGEVLVILFVSSLKVEKVLGALCTLVIIIGVGIEHRADTIRLSGRILDPTQQESITKELSPFLGTRFTIRAYNDDENAVKLLSTISAVLLKAGWVEMPPTGIMGFLLVRGVSVEVRPAHAAALEPAAKHLAAALRAQGIEATEKVAPGSVVEADMVVIRIGHKPQ